MLNVIHLVHLYVVKFNMGSGNKNLNETSDYMFDFSNYFGISERSTAAPFEVTVDSNDSFPSSYSAHNFQVHLSSPWKYTNNDLKRNVTCCLDSKYKQHFSEQNFYNYQRQEQKRISGSCHLHTNSKPKTQQDTLKIKLKKKRKRTMFTTEQIIALEEVFHKKPYINSEERTMMMKRLQISEKSIKVWFQNRRRLADKRSKVFRSDSPSSDMTDTYLDKLTMIETNINQNTDVYGYVRLDNSIMIELVNVIDEYLSQDPNYHVEEVIQPNQIVINENKVIYEPISPVSSENSDEIDLTRDFENHSFQQLANITMESLLFY